MHILICRTLLIYFCVLVAMRLMGKRQLGELQPGELVSTMLISNLASISIESATVPLTSSLVPLFLITAIEITNAALTMKSPLYSRILEGRPKIVIRDGAIDQAVLRQLRLSAADLMAALRAKDVFDLQDVSYAVVETNGSLSVAPVPAQEPPGRAELEISPDAAKATVLFVIDGRILSENLRWCGKDEAWLQKQARKRHLAISDLLVALGSDGPTVFFIKKEERPEKGAPKKGQTI